MHWAVWVVLIIAAIVLTAISSEEKPKYTNGHEYEQYVAWWLRTHGYAEVKVTQRSGDYGADVLCRDKTGQRVAVQCKMYKGSVGYRAVEEALAGMHYYKCDRAMVVTTGVFTQQARQAARKCGVELKERVV